MYAYSAMKSRGYNAELKSRVCIDVPSNISSAVLAATGHMDIVPYFFQLRVQGVYMHAVHQTVHKRHSDSCSVFRTVVNVFFENKIQHC